MLLSLERSGLADGLLLGSGALLRSLARHETHVGAGPTLARHKGCLLGDVLPGLLVKRRLSGIWTSSIRNILVLSRGSSLLGSKALLGGERCGLILDRPSGAQLVREALSLSIGGPLILGATIAGERLIEGLLLIYGLSSIGVSLVPEKSSCESLLLSNGLRLVPRAIITRELGVEILALLKSLGLVPHSARSRELACERSLAARRNVLLRETLLQLKGGEKVLLALKGVLSALIGARKLLGRHGRLQARALGHREARAACAACRTQKTAHSPHLRSPSP